jgi:hypothetical protein
MNKKQLKKIRRAKLLKKKAKQMKIKRKFSELSSDGRNDTAKILTISEFEKVNQASIDAHLNRNILFDVFKRMITKAYKKSEKTVWVGVDWNSILLIPFMIHLGMHKEPHMRCELYTMGLIDGFNLVDIPMELFKSLKSVNPQKKYDLFDDESKECA